MSNEITINSGETLKIKKDDSVVDEIIIDRGGDSSSNAVHFVMEGGNLEVEGVTLTGGRGEQGGVVHVHGGSATFKSCSIFDNIANEYDE